MEQLLLDLEKIGCNIPDGLKRFSNNEGLYLKYLSRFPEEETFFRFREAFDCADYETARNEIHTLKGIAGNLGLSDLYTLSQEILQLLKTQDYDKTALCVKTLCAKHLQCIETICRWRTIR